jgi:hypoxanthine-DNA glycosylase
MFLKLVCHTLEPVYRHDSRILILGTMPSPLSRKYAFYYANPRNRFWPVLAAVFNTLLPADIAEKRALVLNNGLALWDVLASCKISGAADASIREACPNDFTPLLKNSQIKKVVCTGAKAYDLYRKLCEKKTGITALRLPSTSPANQQISFDALTAAYRAALTGN